jgi:hypothetical protein
VQDREGVVSAIAAIIFNTTQQAKLAADDGDSRDSFGESVAMSSDDATALISARVDDDANGRNAGSVYVFENSGGSWTQQAKLAADDGDSGDIFGESVAMSSDGTTALIGAPDDEDPNGELADSAYSIYDAPNAIGSAGCHRRILPTVPN